MANHPTNPAARTAQIILTFPMKGINRSAPRWQQPEGTTTDCLNVVPYPGGDARGRGGMRPGLTVVASIASTKIELMTQAPYGTTTGTSYVCYAVVGTNSIASGSLPTNLAIGAGGSNALPVTGIPATACDIFGFAYFANGGTSYPVLNLSTNATSALSASTGSLPTKCKLACEWRSRLVLANQVGTSPQNIFMSRAGVPADWDYSQTDALAAVALNSSKTAGRIGDPVNALIPFSNDLLLIGCDNAIYVMRGDPADGGTIQTVTRDTGVYSQDAWCISDDGDCYFMGTAGFFKIPAGTTQVESLSNNRLEYFFRQTFDPSQRFSMVYDNIYKGVWMSGRVGGAWTGMYYDERNDGFFPQAYGGSAIGAGPTTWLLWSDNVNGTMPILYCAGTTGNICKLDTSNVGDGTFYMTAYVNFAPFRPAGTGTATLTNVEAYMGDAFTANQTNFHASINISSGKSEWDAQNPARGFYFDVKAQGRYGHKVCRVAGGVFVVGINSTNSTAPLEYWSMERIVLTFTKSGIQR